MKKKLLIPCLLLAGSLTACESGLISGGEPYKEGDAAKVSEALKTEKQDKVKTMSYKQTIEMDMTTKSGDEKASGSVDSTLKAELDLDNKTAEVSYSMKAKSKGTSESYSATVKAKGDGNGNFQVTDSKGNYAELKDSINFGELFDVAKTSIYCWNFTIETEDLGSALEEVDILGGSMDAGKFVNDLKESIVIKGDVANGTFDVGLSKEVKASASYNLEGMGNMKMDFTFTKMKYSFKDCMLKSSIIGLECTGDMSIPLLGSMTYSYDITTKGEYSYSFK